MDDVLKPHGSLLLTVLRRCFWCDSCLVFGVRVSCRILYSFVGVSCIGLITSVGEERAIFLLLFTCNYMVSVWRGFLFLGGAWDWLRYFILALPVPSINYFTHAC